MFVLSLNKIIVAGALTLTACTSTQKDNLSSGNPQEVINEIEALKETSRQEHRDLLAYDKFKDAEQSLEEGITKFKNDDEQNDVLSKLSVAKSEFIAAAAITNSRSNVPDRLLAARTATLQSGVRNDNDLKERLEEIDESLRDESDEFTKQIAVDDVSQYEKDYLKLETRAVQHRELNEFRDIVKNAKNNRAPKLAPLTFRKADSSLKAAENMILQSPRNPENYRESVAVAKQSTKLLADVMDKLQGVARGATEQAALELVQVSGDLQDKTEEALSSANKVRIQKAMDDTRQKFSKDEAEVYQRGSDLIIRLKKIDFASGSAMIPSDSMDLLSKINGVIVNLNSPNIEIQGHTDSTGGRKINQELSQKRSQAVAQYFESLKSPYRISASGHGESQPIANNQTKQGRSLNRRVDIIVSTQ